MMKCAFGEVILATFSFTDQSGVKKRPTVVEQRLSGRKAR